MPKAGYGQAQGLIDFLQKGGVPPWLATMFIAMLPIFELRGAIPVGHQVLGLPLAAAVIVSVIGNMLPVIPILLLLGPVSAWLSRYPVFKRFFDWVFNRTRSKSELVKKYEMIGLMLFVAVPLPMTGAWTGAAAAFLFGIKFWPALWAISFGVLIAAAIVTTLVLMGIWGAVAAGLALAALAVSAVWKSLKIPTI
ncbi:MAG: small multi-drug export protein [Deltaproteobacteria bacterium]|nr:small multi-drug export protein [Deltaproteobacteria bacterium]